MRHVVLVLKAYEKGAYAPLDDLTLPIRWRSDDETGFEVAILTDPAGTGMMVTLIRPLDDHRPALSEAEDA